MSFPATQLNLLVELALGADVTASPGSWSWTNATAFTYTRDIVTIVRGRADESSEAQPWKLTLTVNNRDGRWSSQYPNGAWYGQIRKGTPIRVSAEGNIRFSGFISALPPRRDLSGNDLYVTLEAKGLLYRLAQNTNQRSPLLRSILAAKPDVYWPLEGQVQSTAVLPATGSYPTLTPFGTNILFGATGGAAGTAFSVDFAGGGATLTGPTGLNGTAAGWEFECVVGFDTVPVGSSGPLGANNENGIVAFDMPGSGFYNFSLLTVFNPDASGNTYFGAISATTGGTAGDVMTTVPIVAGVDYHIRITINATPGPNGTFDMYINGVNHKTLNLIQSGLLYPTAVRLNPLLIDVNALPANATISHLAIWKAIRGSDTTYQAAPAYAGELAHVRASRLGTEDGLTITTSATESQAMGPQPVDTLLNLLYQCEQTDQAFLYENTTFGLVFQSHTERENLTTALALNWNSKGIAEPFEPSDDDPAAMNDSEVTRTNGAVARITSDMVPELASADLSIKNIGDRNEQQTYSLSTDLQPIQVAGWRVHMGTMPGYRYPSLSLNFAANNALISGFVTGDLAFRTTISNPQNDFGPDSPDLIVEGYTETLGPFQWDVACNCSLGRAWRVFRLSNDSADTNEFLGRVDNDPLSAIRAAITSGTASIPFDPNFYFWTTAADDFPMTVRCEGETMTLSSIATTAATFVAVGTPAHANNASVTPALYAGNTGGDIIFIFAATNGSGTLSTPAGYKKFADPLFTNTFALYAKVHSGSESAPTVGYSGGVLNDTVSAVTFGFRNMPTTLDLDSVYGETNDIERTSSTNNGSGQNIPTPGIYPYLQDGCVLLLLCWKDIDYTSVTPPAGWTEMVEASTTVGNHQALYICYQIQTTAANVLADQAVVTGGSAAFSYTVAVALQGGFQTMTVSARSANGVVKAHGAGALISVDDDKVLAL